MSVAVTSVFALTASMVDKRNIDKLIEKLAEPPQVVSQSGAFAKMTITNQQALDMIQGSMATTALLNEKCKDWEEKVRIASQIDIFDESDATLIEAIADLEDSASSINNTLNMFKVLYFHVKVAPEWRPHQAMYKDAGEKIIRCLSTMRNLHQSMASILRQHLPQAAIEVSGSIAEQDMKALITHSHSVWGIPPAKWS